MQHSVAKIEFPNGKKSPFFTYIWAVSAQQELKVTFYSLKEHICHKQKQILLRPYRQFVSTSDRLLLVGNFRRLVKTHDQYFLSCCHGNINDRLYYRIRSFDRGHVLTTSDHLKMPHSEISNLFSCKWLLHWLLC